MSSNWKTYHKRGQVVELARRLARSGRHADHTTIIQELAHVDGFEAARVRLADRAVQAQLDKLCLMARVSPRASRERM